MHSPTPELVIACGAVIPVVAGAFVGLRFYARRRYAKCGIDDYLALLALLILIGMSIVLIVGAAKFGFGRHVTAAITSGYNDDLSEITTGTKHVAVVSEFMLPLGVGTTKQSILFFYRRIFRGRAFNIMSWILIAICLVWMLTVFLFDVFQCGHHVKDLWTSEKVIAGTCLPGTPLAEYSASSDFVTDVLILVFPIYWTSKMQMARTRKILVLVVFFIGGLAVLASMARLIVTVEVYRRHNIDPDQISFLTNVTYTQTIEMGICIIAVCLPTLGCLVPDDTKQKVNRMLNWILPSALRTSRQYSLKDAKKVTEDKSRKPSDSSEAHLANIENRFREDGHLGYECFADDNREKPDEEQGSSITVTAQSSMNSMRPSNYARSDMRV